MVADDFLLGKRKRENEEQVEKHDGVFQSPLAIFFNFPINCTFHQYTKSYVYAQPFGDPAANVYTFFKSQHAARHH